MPVHLVDQGRVLFNEALTRPRRAAAIFSVVMLLATLLGIAWPKKYTSSTTVFVEEENVLGSLMKGAAVQTEVADRARIAREVIFGRALMQKVIEQGGWSSPNPPPAQMERLINEIKERTVIANVGENLIRIEYSDSDPARAQRTAQAFAQLFITESLAVKTEESSSAFKFIDDQVREYQHKLEGLDERLKQFRNSNADARPEADADVRRRVTDLKGRLEELQQQLREAEIKRASLQSQLSGEAEASTGFSRSDQYRTRIAEMQNQLSNLLLTYHDTYPDVVRLRRQIEELRAEMEAEEKHARERRGGGGYVDEGLLANPIYQQLRGDLYQTNTTIQTIRSRIGETERQIEEERRRGERVQSAEADLAELTRDYEVNRDLYQDLLRRREAARVSMSLDQKQQGLKLRVDEPAFLPHEPAGPRLIHFLSGGFVLGVLAPFGLLYGFQRIDRRVRMESVLMERVGVPSAGVVPHLAGPREVREEARRWLQAGGLALGALLLSVVIALLRTQGGA